MRLRPDQLETHLQRSGLAPVYCLSGDEPLQMLEAADMIRLRARETGTQERTVLDVDKGFDWNTLARESGNLSLFSDRRLIELRLGGHKPGKSGSDALTEYANNINNDNILLVTTARADKATQQSRWYRALDQAGVTIPIWPVDGNRLSDWIVQRMRRLGKQLDRDAAELIAQRTEGNLLAARQELEKLCLLVDKDRISLQDVMESVADSARHDVFVLIEQAYLGRTERVAIMLRGLRGEGTEPIGIFGALMWEFRRLCSMSDAVANGAGTDRVMNDYRIWPQRRKATGEVLKRLDINQFTGLLMEANTIDRSLKGANHQDSWELLENFLFRLAGIRLQSP